MFMIKGGDQSGVPLGGIFHNKFVQIQTHANRAKEGDCFEHGGLEDCHIVMEGVKDGKKAEVM